MVGVTVVAEVVGDGSGSVVQYDWFGNDGGDGGFVELHAHIHELKSRGCAVMHDVDATKMGDDYVPSSLKYDRIVFNFPHAGFSKIESRQSQIRRNQNFVMSFLKNAKKMVKDDGEIHISRKSNGFFKEWKIELLGLFSSGLRLKEEVAFNLSDYPGYNTKYG
ncbi:uncharacterized protein At4g26485-like [Cornus florida]|uniref:uncharacterized protein At4g26485-like n=1 Tax=Cornus florida TaxID=4283 RepID=UPI0028A2AE75|nr:uncharacterized protein At4g26485-like [Cornus florida]